MKKCPFCAEEIQDEAIKCRHCGEFLTKPAGQRWYFQTHWVVISFLCVGPFMLPLVWFHPRYSLPKKIIISVIVLILSWFLYQAFLRSLKVMQSSYEQLLGY